MRRLYVGGLSHLITEKDLKDRFGKFGNVEDVELRTRRDDDGVPYKTFGYVNIDISDADLKKCLTVLNKSKWKGGTLQIETAKESFLHRLAQERQAAAEQCPKQPEAEDKRHKLLNSLSKAGVDNFTMKAAVPGTEIPGHKDWIVSKFGRVLPVLQLRCQKGNKARTVKYDPSKYCHNIRKLDRDATVEPTPVTQLTWEIQGGDDDISKKRRGEFPPYQPPRPKKSRTNVVNSYDTVAKTKPAQIVESASLTEDHFTNGFVQSTNQRAAHRRGAYLNNSDVDSDEEIRRLVAIQQISHSALQQVSEDDNLEVVGFDYLVKSGKKGTSEDENEGDYDSADTDELFASRKPPPPPPQKKSTPLIAEHVSENNTDRKRKTKRKSKDGGREDGGEDSSDAEECRKPTTSAQRGGAAKQNCQKKGGSSENQSNKMADLPLSESDGDDEDEDEEELDSADSCSDSDYEGMFSNVTHLEISLADLQRLAEENHEMSETTAPSILSGSLKQKSNVTSGPTEEPAPRKGTLPDDILAAILEDNSSGDEQKRKKRKRKGVISTSLPAFQGTRALNQVSDEAQNEEDGRSTVKKQKSEADLNPRATTDRTSNQQKHTEIKQTSDSSEEDEEEEEEQKRKRDVVKNMAVTQCWEMAPSERAKTVSSSSSGSDDEVEEQKKKSPQTVVAAKASPSSSSSSSEEDEEKPPENAVEAAPFAAPDSESSSSEEDKKEEQSLPRMSLTAEGEQAQQRKANLRRLAAVQQRQKEAEEQKKLIQGALANPDAPKPGAGKHIVFGSDDDEDDEDDQQTTSEVSTSRKVLFQEDQSEDESTGDEPSSDESSTNKEKEHLKPSGPQLFGGSDAEDDGDEEEDGSRFEIRPQFEGQAGQKLMELQSRFGTDERFRMDSRFLEDGEKESEESEKKESRTEDDEALEQERKKNLDILQSVLGSSQHACSKTSSKAKTFRDVSSLHYDPSKEEHAAFETTIDKTKESKSARRKKREAAQKLPEVSKEIYFEVSGDLTTVFGPSKNDVTEQEESTTWDQEEEEDVGGQDEEPTSSVLTADPSAGKEESTGFRFSFFGDDTETENKLTEYKVESIQAPKASWQQDPRFHDSSSDEEEEEQEEEEDQTSSAAEAVLCSVRPIRGSAEVSLHQDQREGEPSDGQLPQLGPVTFSPAVKSTMCAVLFLLLLFLRSVELRRVPTDPEFQSAPGAAGAEPAGMEKPVSTEGTSADRHEAPTGLSLKRAPRGAKDGTFRRRDPLPPSGRGHPRQYDDPSGYFTTPRSDRYRSAPPANASSARGPGLLNPLFPVTDGSYWAYAVMLLALLLFAAGIVGNLALMCIVWHNFYLKSAWNCILAGLAFWDFLVLFFCLPVVVFHELTLKRLLGDLSCRLVPYLEVTSLGVATFSLCALSIDRFHAATGPGPLQTPKVEPCQSILSKLSVIWLGSMVLAAPELLLWQLLQDTVSLPMLPTDLQSQPAGSLMAALRTRTDTFKVDVCVREPSVELPESIYSLVLTYHEARMWWFFGCYLCLPLLFTLACDLVTRQVLAQRQLQKPGVIKVTSRCSSSSSSSTKKKQHVREVRLRSTVMALTVLYISCNLPESICNITLAYVSVSVSAALPALALPALGLIGQFLLFARCSATPVLLLFLCRSLGQAFMDCCCCCCEECLPDSNSSSASSASTAATSTLSSPTSASPSSLSPSGKEETMKAALMTEPAALDGAKDCPIAIGTPC